MASSSSRTASPRVLATATPSFGCWSGIVYEWEEGLILRVTFDTDIDAARADAQRLAEERE